MAAAWPLSSDAQEAGAICGQRAYLLAGPTERSVSLSSTGTARVPCGSAYQLRLEQTPALL